MIRERLKPHQEQIVRLQIQRIAAAEGELARQKNTLAELLAALRTDHEMTFDHEMMAFTKEEAEDPPALDGCEGCDD